MTFLGSAASKKDSSSSSSSSSSSGQLASQSVNKGQLQTILRDLLLHKLYKVEIWAAKANSSQWERVKKASPGNMEELDELLQGSASSLDDQAVTMAIKVASSGGLKVVPEREREREREREARSLGVCLIELIVLHGSVSTLGGGFGQCRYESAYSLCLAI
jgi:hypothetical protein